MRVTTIGVIGYGFVGKAVEYGFKPKNKILVYDKYLESQPLNKVIVIGGDMGRVRRQLVDLYRESFPQTPIFQTDPTTAEMVKYMANTFLASKVTFANEMWQLCEKLGIKYEEVKQMVVADRRIYNSHLDVTTDRGFGGKYFPKDTVALLGLAKELGVKLSVLEAVWKKNLKIRHVRDWEEIPGAVSKT